MPTPSQMHYPKTKDPAEFEQLCRDILNNLYHRSDSDCFELYGGKGQKQHGIDIRGLDLSDQVPKNTYIVAQCKNYLTDDDKALKKALTKDVNRVDSELDFAVSRLIIMTSRDRTTALQDLATSLQDSYDFTIEIKFWDDLENVLAASPDLVARYYPTFVAQQPVFIQAAEASHIPSLRSNFVPNPNEVIGRESELAAIETYFSCEETSPANHVVTIRGIGGSGKSVLAKKYAEIHQSDFEYIIEVSTDVFKSAVNLIPIANADQNPSLTDYTQRLLFLREEMNKHKTLLIVHDYNTNDDSDAHNWSSLPCHVLLTSWNHQTIGEELNLDRHNQSDDNAIAIMRYYYLLHASDERKAELESTFDSDLPSVKALVQRVERHPLTIKLLASQMTCLEDELLAPSDMLAELEMEGLKDKQHLIFHTPMKQVTRPNLRIPLPGIILPISMQMQLKKRRLAFQPISWKLSAT